MTSEQATEEYFDEAKNWELPPSWEWPDDPGYRSTSNEGEPQVFAEGSGRVDATFYWYCAWGRTLIETDSAVARAAALEQVLRVRETPFYQIGLLPPDQQREDAILEAVEVGDLTEFTSIVDVNCPTR